MLAALALGALLVGVGTLQSEDTVSRTFDGAIWADEKLYYEPPYPRVHMAEDVLAKHLRTGMTRDQIIETLGASTDTPYFKDFDLVYWLGHDAARSAIDASWLVIRLGAEGKLAEAKIVTD